MDMRHVGENPDKENLSFGCKRHPLVRKIWLGNCYNILENLDFGGVYFDIMGFLECANVRHGCDIEGSYPVEESMDIREALRIITDNKPNRCMVNHAWGRVQAPDDMLFDFTLPGEHISSQERAKLSALEENLSWN